MKTMKLMTKELERKTPALYSQDGKGMDAVAHVKLFTPDSSWTWLLTEYDPTERRGFGWCDDGQGGGELGYVDLNELEQVRGPMGLPVERDRWFRSKPLAEALKAEGLTR